MYSKIKILHWAYCLEDHQGHGKYYHLSLKLSGVKRWKQVKDEIMKNNNMVLNFLNYHSVYKYIYKSETQVCYSKDYSNLKDVGSPLTKKSTQALCAGHTQNLSTKLMNQLMLFKVIM